jgi:hypothetical protein
MSQYQNGGRYRQSKNEGELQWLEDGIHILFFVVGGSVSTLLRCLTTFLFGAR